MATLSREQLEKAVELIEEYDSCGGTRTMLATKLSHILQYPHQTKLKLTKSEQTEIAAIVVNDQRERKSLSESGARIEQWLEKYVLPRLQYAQPEREEKSRMVHAPTLQGEALCGSYWGPLATTREVVTCKACNEIALRHTTPVEAQPPAQGERDLVERMLDAYNSYGDGVLPMRERMTRALAIAQEETEHERDEKWEKAILDVSAVGWHSTDDFIQHVRKRLTPKVEDPAIQAVRKVLERRDVVPEGQWDTYIFDKAEAIVSAVRKADSGAAEALRKDVK